MSQLRPIQNESPLAFVERADAIGANEDDINSLLKGSFGIQDDGKIKALKLKSSVYWQKFYLEHTQGIFERSGSKYAAITFIQRKNGQAGQRKLTESEITELVDSVGNWPR